MLNIKQYENMNEIKFLTETAKILMNAMFAQTLVDDINNLFRSYYAIDKINFLLYDVNTNQYKDFSRDWIFVQDPEKQSFLDKILKIFDENTKDKFILNEDLYNFNATKEEIKKIKDINNKKDFKTLYYPLYSADEIYGVAEISFSVPYDNFINSQHSLNILENSLIQINTAILNYILKDHMATGLNFYNAMKNIAKIIESQYEIAYIVPQIGEMIDRFIASHLIYIFLKDESKKFKLIWPASCHEDYIVDMINSLDMNTNVLISPNHSIGVFPFKNEEENEVFGALVAYSNIGSLSQTEIEYLMQLTQQSSITIQRANVYSEVLKYATLDALTGLNNRRQFEVRLRELVAQAQRKDLNLSCIMLDIDYFKKVNDNYGHTAGDIVLKSVAEIVSKTLREYDVPCRYGGEEFFILLPHTVLDEAVLVAQRLRQVIMNTKIDITEAKVNDVKFLNVTVSIGVHQYSKEESPEDFYQCADKALYEAKESGRNRVIAYSGKEQ